MPGTSATAYRFSSRLALAIWLLGNGLRSGGPAEGRAVAALAAQLPGGSALGWARREMFGDGRSLPQIVSSLARQGLASALLARLDPADVVQMRKALVHSHALPLAEQGFGVRVVADAAEAEGPLQAPDPSAALPPPPARVRAIAATAAAARAAGNDLAELPAQAVELLLILLQLQADPSRPRAQLVAAAAVVAARPSAVAARPTTVAASHRSAAEATTAATEPAGAAQARSAAPASVPPSVQAPPKSSSVHQHRPALAPASPDAGPPPAALSRPAAAAPATGFPTDFAGLWFLCNAFVAMGLYGDFSRPSGGALALAPSRLLDRLALQWFGSDYGRDPLHEALHRDGPDPPLPQRWQMAPAWLEAFADEEGTELVTSRRHRTLWHPAGFPLEDAPWPGRRGRQRRPLAGRRPPQGGSPAARLRLSHPLPLRQPARWLACLALYLDARIQRATADPALGLASLALPGQVHHGPERLDVHQALNDLPLPLRLAGLDRDPGWLPAEGRTIAFHFQ
ncbi:MAG: hypothetical protein ACK550_10855 [Synechococcaceae cyanobacterium]